MTPEQQLKLAFAEAWLRNPRNAYAAALTITKKDTFAAMQIADKWVWDDDVAKFKAELIDEYGEEHFLPTKCEMIRDVLDRAETAYLDDSYVKLMKLAADMRGFIEKPGLTINNNTQTNNRVMIVPVGKLNDDGTVDAQDWERKAIEQQQALIQ
jgi:hypothetical protein